MVRGSIKLLKDAGSGLSKTLADILVCPLSKQPLRFCEQTNSLISDAIGVSFPIKDGIPSLVPTDGKTLEADEIIKTEDSAESSDKHEADRIGSH
ncbi:protein preY [Pyrus ussuriensis x Pyrus communis]|uniref:Protein preY, mitochondrial n=1 Tax=Pyrus ussuriensis x Pyrus communis TaxID=2448454 RepID=A0A5N5GRH6_9ROSA|nr:protein preY [Pyrus ussuriensis x Pyrus communis]